MNQKDSYKLNFSEKITLLEQDEHLQNLNLDTAPIISTNSVIGLVKDQNGNFVDKATVKLFDTNFNPIIHTETNENGEYIFQGVVNGSYHVYAVKDGYFLSNKADLHYNGTDVTLNDLIINQDTTYSKGSIYGYIKDENNLGVNNAIVKLVNGSGTTISETVSAEDGEYIIPKVDAGNYSLVASAINYTSTTPLSVTVEDNVYLRENLNLTKVAANMNGTINGYVYNPHGNPIPNAFVGLYEEVIAGSLILRATCNTNSEGKYFFGSVSEGTWVVKAKVTQSR